MISLESVSKRYGSKTVVDDLSFKVKEGEIVGFLGPNGAGKTTTLRMISGYFTPTAGRVQVAGFDMATENMIAAQKIGSLPELPPLYDTLSVVGYLRFVAKAKGVSRSAIMGELDRVSVACRLEAVFRQEVFKLSKGYRQRLGLAQALIGKPDVLLLDEPTSGLDPGQIQETTEVIRSFGKEHTVLLSTHILSEVTRICQRVAIINEGRLLTIDTPSGLQRAAEETNRIVLKVTGETQYLRNELLSLNGLREVKIEKPDARGISVIECDVDERDGIDADIARTVTTNWSLHHLERRQPTLENIFLRYVRETPDGSDS